MQTDVRVIEAEETVVETVIDVTHAVIGTPPTLKTTVAREETSTAEVGAFVVDRDRLMVTDTTDQEVIDLAVMTMIEFVTEAPVVSITLNQSVLRALSANLLHLSLRKTSVIEERSLCNSWLPD